MNSFIIVIVAVSIGYFIGKTLEATQEARARFVSYRARTTASFRDWVGGTFRGAIQISAVVLVLYLVFVAHAF